MATSEEKTILRVYGTFAAALVLMLLPNMLVCILALALMAGVLITAYAKRRKADPHGLIADHMTFIIRTIWLGNGIAVISTAIASIYMMKRANHLPLQDCSHTAAQHILDSGAQDMQTINSLMKPCIDGFIAGNIPVLIASVAIAATPPMLYFAFRTAKGLNRARKGHRIGDVKSWL